MKWQQDESERRAQDKQKWQQIRDRKKSKDG